MIVEMKDIGEITPYAKNPRRNDQAVAQVARSIQEFGFNQPIVVDDQGVIVVGHTRLKAAKKLGLAQVPVLVVRDVSQEKLQAYRLADNKLNELADWDDDHLVDELREIIDHLGSAQLTGFSEEEIAALMGDQDTSRDHSAYSKKIDTPLYTPKGECPDIDTLADDSRTRTLINQINQVEMPDEIRKFLITAAQRHTVFDYHSIAEYYCHADSEIQSLMEDSALVIIDFNRAIEQGYVQLSTDLKEIYANSHEPTESNQDDPG